VPRRVIRVDAKSEKGEIAKMLLDEIVHEPSGQKRRKNSGGRKEFSSREQTLAKKWKDTRRWRGLKERAANSD